MRWPLAGSLARIGGMVISIIASGTPPERIARATAVVRAADNSQLSSRADWPSRPWLATMTRALAFAAAAPVAFRRARVSGFRIASSASKMRLAVKPSTVLPAPAPLPSPVPPNALRMPAAPASLRRRRAAAASGRRS
jgi:hypothetical protein